MMLTESWYNICCNVDLVVDLTYVDEAGHEGNVREILENLEPPAG